MDELNITEPWYSLDWFMPDTLLSLTWEKPVFLYLLAVIPILFLIRWFWRYRFNQKLPVAVTQKDLKTSSLTLVRFIPDLLLMVVMGLIMLALARPQKTNEKVPSPNLCHFSLKVGPHHHISVGNNCEDSNGHSQGKTNNRHPNDIEKKFCMKRNPV